MNYKNVIKELTTYRRDERIYKEYYEMQKNSKSLASFFNRYKDNPKETAYLKHPDMIDFSPTEDRFISVGRNTSIMKHPRYFPFFFHKHEFFEMIYVLSGTCTQIFHDREILLKTGEFCIMAPDVVHGIKVFDDSVILNILIRRSTFLDIFINTVRDKTQISMFFLNNIYEKNKIPYLLFHTNNDSIIRNYILDMYVEQSQRDEYSDRIICSILTIFFTQLIRFYKDDMEIAEIHVEKKEYEAELLNYIVSNYADLTLEKLSSHFHFSVPYCSKLLKKICGLTFSELQENIRLQQSEYYLLYTNLSVSDISEKIGFKNPETFTRMFRRRHQITPSKYRKLNINAL